MTVAVAVGATCGPILFFNDENHKTHRENQMNYFPTYIMLMKINRPLVMIVLYMVQLNWNIAKAVGPTWGQYYFFY